MSSDHPLGSLTDVDGLRVGHHHRVSSTWRTGTTVVLTPPGTRGGVSVRGAAPGTRETDLLGPDTLVSFVDAICLTGGSAFGLDAAGGVMDHLVGRRRGFPVGEWVVPIVPAAVIFDLGRAGRFENRPDAEFGRRASRRASKNFAVGAVGAGAGAKAGGLQGGIGTASVLTDEGHRVAALAVVNSVGFVVDPETGVPWHRGRWSLPDPSAAGVRRVRAAMTAAPTGSLNTTIGVVATDAPLTKPQCSKVADVAHDGLARAIRPAHSMNDGDCIFALATGHEGNVLDVRSLNKILTAAAEVFAEACTGAILAARNLGGPPAYRDLVAPRKGSSRPR